MELKVLKLIYKFRRETLLFNVLRYPNPFLEAKAAPVELPLSEFDANCMQRMKDLMFGVDGKKTPLIAVGMAAPQIGVGKQMFVYCPAGPSGKLASKVQRNLIEVYNPEILRHGKQEVVLHEGCVSDPTFYAPVKRWQVVEVVYYDKAGKAVSKKLTGWEARVFQHEVDHLNGVLCRFRHLESSAHSPVSKPQSPR